MKYLAVILVMVMMVGCNYKQECPNGLMQIDLDLFSVVPGTSRFCIGFTDDNTTIPDGMRCFHYNLI